MIMSEYEERFHPPKPSLHQIFTAARGRRRERRGSLPLWVAAALVAVMTMTCKVTSHHTIHSGTGDGSQVWDSGTR